MAMAMAGGAKTNSIRVAKPAINPLGRAKGAVGVGKGPPACGMAVVNSVKLKIKAQYIAAMASATIIKPSVPAWDQP